jgi:hypothetical protein
MSSSPDDESCCQKKKKKNATNNNNITRANIDSVSEDLKLAHELAHALRAHDTDTFIHVYDNKIPLSFTKARVITNNLTKVARTSLLSCAVASVGSKIRKQATSFWTQKTRFVMILAFLGFLLLRIDPELFIN